MVQRSYSLPWLQARLLSARVLSKKSPFSIENSLVSRHNMASGMNGKSGDRTDVPINFRFLQMLLQIADDPEIGLGDYSQGVRVGPGNRMPRLPALFRPKKKLRLASQFDPLDYLEGSTDSTTVWRRNYSTLQPLEQQGPRCHARSSNSWSSFSLI